MNNDAAEIRAFLNKNPYCCEFPEKWPIQGNMIVHVGLSSHFPPKMVISSILAIVINDENQVLYLHPNNNSGNISHVLIGGRPKNDESCEEAVIREVGEETGWLIEPMSIIGYRHFHQLDLRSEQSDRQYPDFIQPIFVSRALRYVRELIISQDILPAEMIDYERAASMIIPDQGLLLRAAHESTMVNHAQQSDAPEPASPAQ